MKTAAWEWSLAASARFPACAAAHEAKIVAAATSAQAERRWRPAVLTPAATTAGYATAAAASTAAAPARSEETRLRSFALEDPVHPLAEARASLVGPRQNIEAIVAKAGHRVLGHLGW